MRSCAWRCGPTSGLARVSVAEGWTHDALILLAELALRTSRIELGTGVVSVWGRTPATMALAAAGLQRCSGGRFSLGVGAGSPPLTEGLHGMAWGRPALRLRETLTAIRALLAGDRLPNPAAGARPLRAGVAAEPPVPLVLAALAPESIRLAGELADEWAPFLWARSRVTEGRALLDDGESRAAAATRTRISVCVPVALGPDEQTARRLAAWWLATYATRMGPLYPRMLGERFGMSAALDAVIDAAQRRARARPARGGRGACARGDAHGDLRRGREGHRRAGSPRASTASSSCCRPDVPRPSLPRSFAYMVAEVNWAGNFAYRAARVHRPASLDELREIVAARAADARARLAPLVQRHRRLRRSWSSLDALPADVGVDRDGETVTVRRRASPTASWRARSSEGLALHNLASLPHISVAGAIATATHGSGDAQRQPRDGGRGAGAGDVDGRAA